MGQQTPWRLGLDLGTSSIGWAVVDLTRTKGGKPKGIREAGVRIFEAGVEGDIEQGKDSSRATKRREARQPRRQNWRTQWRKQKLFARLVSLGLLPTSESSQPVARQSTLAVLDEALRSEYLPEGDHEAQQKLTYILRAKAVEIPLEPYEVGRALYALAQRRGYLSNRKAQSDDDESSGTVATSIGELQQGMNELGSDTTISQYFVQRVNPVDSTPEKIRHRYTARKMFTDEFDRIRDTQKNHLTLSPEDWNELWKLIFFQRPLKSQKHRIGRCKLEPEERRCEECLPVYQEFRILQKVNDLQVIQGDEPKRPIHDFPGAREALISALQTVPKLTAKQAAKAAGLPKGAAFSLEEHEGLDLIGHRTNVKMMAAFGKRWLQMPEQQQEQICREVLHYRSAKALKQRAMSAWGLDEEHAVILSNTHLENDYARHSRKAMKKLVGYMREGSHYRTAIEQAGYDVDQFGEALDRLPPVTEWDSDIGNPAIIRDLTELRKVVNALIAKHGKPATVHIEVARELKNSRKKRKELHSRNQQNRKRREQAAKAILEQCGIGNPTRRDVEKWLLAEECNWRCPYCSRSFGASDLVGSHAEFNVEHIYPRRFLDDSYLNKTIACRKCNAHKKDLTPKQAFAGKDYGRILSEVKQFNGFARDEKLRRFMTDAPDEDFVSRHLNDTRYNARLAANYLATLFGGRYDQDEEITRIVTPSGGLTWMLRTGWQLNDILSDDNQKTRDDHRHHAVDAIVVAFSDQSRIQQAAKAAILAQETNAKPFLRAVEYPWTGFKNDIAYAIEAINVSHRPTRTISGPLHAESIYSKPHEVNGNGKPQYRIRKELRKLSAKEITSEQIVDPAIRQLVQQKFAELGGKDPAKIFAEEANLPRLPNRNGPDIPIRKVRLAASVTARPVGRGPRQRNVASGKDSNYASMVYAVLDKNGNEKKWIHEIVTRLDAAELYSANLKTASTRGEEKILIPDEQDGARRFKFALRKNDMLLLEGPDGRDQLYRVQKLSKDEIQLCEHTKPTVTNPDRTPWNRVRSVDVLRKRNMRIVTVSPLGQIMR